MPAIYRSSANVYNLGHVCACERASLCFHLMLVIQVTKRLSCSPESTNYCSNILKKKLKSGLQIPPFTSQQLHSRKTLRTGRQVGTSTLQWLQSKPLISGPLMPGTPHRLRLKKLRIRP
ncbi:hypothetical protein BaRGS_00013533 [Batillaria attramentaria]|uniref:SWIM-type domain-containing protein n=1 Tax=Batillaria attramentaria TaxID=370345 RepID=A0ABD0L768_9CAEN